MTQRTCNVIICCKNRGPMHDRRNKILTYISNECQVSKDDLTEDDLNDILKDAVIDYLKEGNAQDFIRCFFDSIYKERTDAIISAFARVQVKKRTALVFFDGCGSSDYYTYVNGFTDDLLETSKIELQCLYE